ncbi:MAG TPA: hypothetical protein VM489_02545 [Burkholderiales bacterium]|nr:hypothetical protein [Burkholderiales bacterium]
MLRERMPPGVDLAPAGSRELGATLAADTAKWGKVVAAAGIKPE